MWNLISDQCWTGKSTNDMWETLRDPVTAAAPNITPQGKNWRKVGHCDPVTQSNTNNPLLIIWLSSQRSVLGHFLHSAIKQKQHPAALCLCTSRAERQTNRKLVKGNGTTMIKSYFMPLMSDAGVENVEGAAVHYTVIRTSNLRNTTDLFLSEKDSLIHPYNIQTSIWTNKLLCCL